MGGSGSALAMIQSIRNNRMLLGRRRAYFKTKVEAQQAAEKLNITYQKATREQLRLIRKKLKKQRLYKWFKVFVLLLLLSPLIGYVAVNIGGAIAEELPKTDAQLVGLYYADLKKGDDYFRKKQFNNAITMYLRADKIIKETSAINYRIAITSTYTCLLYNERCGNANWAIKDLYEQDTTDVKAIKLNELLVTAYYHNNPEDL
jgi:hypothetical protein